MSGAALFAVWPSSRPLGKKRNCANLWTRLRANPPPNENEEGRLRGDIPMPQGVWWIKHANVKEEAAYGANFVIHRCREASTHLVVAPQEEVTLQVWHPQPVRGQLMLRPPYHLLPPEFDSDAVVIEVEETESTSALVFAGQHPVCDPAHLPSSSRRRTQKVKFTCNRCQTRSEKFVNPHAWNHGVVFCRCDGCGVVHLIRDERGIFSCLKGPLFPRRLDLEGVQIPKGLPQNPVMPATTEGERDSDTEFWLF